jgi:hypothetical protein
MQHPVEHGSERELGYNNKRGAPLAAVKPPLRSLAASWRGRFGHSIWKSASRNPHRPYDFGDAQ